MITAGTERAVEAIRTALAMGADKAVRIDTAGSAPDSYTTSIMLAEVIKAGNFDLVLGGKQAVDDDAAQTLQGVAERLDWAVVPVVSKLEVADDGSRATVHAPVSGSLKEVLEVPLPAVIGCDKGLNSPRYPSLPGIMKAKSKPVEVRNATELLGENTAKVAWQGYQLPPQRAAGKKITGEPAEVVSQLVQWLRDDAKIL